MAQRDQRYAANALDINASFFLFFSFRFVRTEREIRIFCAEFRGGEKSAGIGDKSTVSKERKRTFRDDGFRDRIHDA